MRFLCASDDAGESEEARSGGDTQRKYEVIKAIYFATATGTTVSSLPITRPISCVYKISEKPDFLLRDFLRA